MRYFYFLLFSIIVFANSSVFSQCTGGTNGGGISIFATWQTTGTTNINGGTYRTFNAIAGNIYYFSFLKSASQAEEIEFLFNKLIKAL